ncbi:MAG: cytochrome-c peroxidase [Flavobacteriales bacterium]|nr:cytochrome-c peroxidase [Flavobacteriales bacterium]
MRHPPIDAEALRQQALAFFHPLPEVVEHPAGPDTPEKVALGYKLFLDPQLSEDGTISCNSCHKLDHYGVDNSPTSIGVRGQHGGRNSPTVFNAALHNMQFWDGRATDVEQQAGMPDAQSGGDGPSHRSIHRQAVEDGAGLSDPVQSGVPRGQGPAQLCEYLRGHRCVRAHAFDPPRAFDDFLKAIPPR